MSLCHSIIVKKKLLSVPQGKVLPHYDSCSVEHLPQAINMRSLERHASVRHPLESSAFFGALQPALELVCPSERLMEQNSGVHPSYHYFPTIAAKPEGWSCSIIVRVRVVGVVMRLCVCVLGRREEGGES